MKHLRLLLLPLLVITSACGIFSGPRKAAELPAEFRMRSSAPIESGIDRGALSAAEAEYLDRIQSGTFRASATGNYPSSASGEAQSVAVAQARARREALRALAEQITGSTASSDDGLEAIFGPRARWSEALAQGLTQYAEMQYQQGTGGIVANTRIPGSQVVEILSASAGSAAGGAESPQVRAERAALETARRGLLQQVMSAQPRRRTGSRYEEQLSEIIATLEPAEVTTDSEGNVEVLLVLPSRLLPSGS